MSSDTILGVTARRVGDLPEAMDGLVRLARAGLGLSGFGVQILELPPLSQGPPHDETATGQEELYVALRGSGEVVFGEDDERVTLGPDELVAVGPTVTRRLATGPDGLRVLCVGGAPGKAYEAPEWTEGR